MVNSISFAGVTSRLTKSVKSLNNTDIKTLVKYTSGETLNQVKDTFGNTFSSAATSAGVFEGVPFADFLRKMKKAQKGKYTKLTGEAIEKIKAGKVKLSELDKTTVQKFKDILTGKGKLSEKLKNIYTTGKTYLKDGTAAKQEIKNIINNNGAKEVVTETVKKEPGIFSKAMNLIKKPFVAAKNLVKKPFSNAAGALAKRFPKIAGKLGKLGKIGKILKSSGAGFMMAFSGIIEGVTEVIPTFKELGFKKGMKQLLKSTVKVAGDTAGFIGGQAVGSTVGALAGAKIGALLGSVAPGIGNVIGAGLGFVGGLLGSFVLGKITKSVTGPSEREIAKEQQEKQQCEQIAASEDNIKLLKEITAQKIAEEYNQYGKLSEDSLAALKILEKNGVSNPFAA